jgi:signal transduction histidine kinase
MKTQSSGSPSTAYSLLPLPGRFFRYYGLFWDVVSILAFSLAALTVLASHWPNPTINDWWAAGLCVAQVVWYVVWIALGPWPMPNWRPTVYFVGGLIMWAVAGWLNPEIFWLGFTYFGQMYGLLPPQAALPGTALVLIINILTIVGWRWDEDIWGIGMGFGFMWMSGGSVYLFISAISRTSRERAALIVELEAAKHQLEASREREAELAALRERERLARDLHDSLGHALVSVSVQLEAIQRLYKVDPERASGQVDELKTLTRKSMEDLRRSLEGLRVSGLGDVSLRDALQALCVETGQRINAEVSCSVTGEVDTLTPAVAETLWRAAQEALTNAGRHANARHVQVSLDVRGEAATLKIADDGVGLTPGYDSRPGHYGLRGMRERVEGLGGTLGLKNGDGAGTTVEVNLPLFAK